VIVNERKLLMRCLELIDWEAEASRTSKEAKTALDVKTVTRYAKLTEAEAKVLVVEDKWLAAIATDVQATRGLTRRRRTGV
jgi:type I restriction enzyme M protein